MIHGRESVLPFLERKGSEKNFFGKTAMRFFLLFVRVQNGRSQMRFFGL